MHGGIKKNYSEILGVSLYSLFENNKDENIKVYIISTKLEESNKKELIRIAKQYDKEIIFSDNKEIIPLKIKEILQEGIDGLPLTTYYRLFFNQCFPELKDRLLYIDCDTIINKNLHYIYYSDFEDNVFIGTKEKVLCYGRAFLMRQGLTIKNYVNAGVLLYNIPKFLEYDLFTEIQQVNKKYEIAYKDQDYINIIFKDKIKINNKLQTRFLGNSTNNINDYYIFHIIEKISKPLTQTPKLCISLYNNYLKRTKWSHNLNKRQRIRVQDVLRYIYVLIIDRTTIFNEWIFGTKIATKIFYYYAHLGVFIRSFLRKK